MKSLHFLITAGPTHEPIDPVRFIGNRSSGKMGYALAEAALEKNHQVTLISGPTHIDPPEGIELIQVQTALEMKEEVFKYHEKADVIIMVAAVADYRPENISNQKIKKNNETLNLTLVKNPDILFELGKVKKDHQILIGFAAETENLIQNAKIKLEKKNCDWIIANDVSRSDIGFNQNENQITMISASESISLPLSSKKDLSYKVIETILRDLIP